MNSDQVATSGVIRRSLLNLEDVFGPVLTPAIIDEIGLKGISYETNCDDIVYHIGEIRSALSNVLGPRVGDLVLDELCKRCRELQ